jgi:hypothetical protein
MRSHSAVTRTVIVTSAAQAPLGAKLRGPVESTDGDRPVLHLAPYLSGAKERTVLLRPGSTLETVPPPRTDAAQRPRASDGDGRGHVRSSELVHRIPVTGWTLWMQNAPLGRRSTEKLRESPRIGPFMLSTRRDPGLHPNPGPRNMNDRQVGVIRLGQSSSVWAPSSKGAINRRPFLSVSCLVHGQVERRGDR